MLLLLMDQYHKKQAILIKIPAALVFAQAEELNFLLAVCATRTFLVVSIGNCMLSSQSVDHFQTRDGR